MALITATAIVIRPRMYSQSSTEAATPARRIADGLSDLIGRTPTVRIPVPDAAPGTELVAKLEKSGG